VVSYITITHKLYQSPIRSILKQANRNFWILAKNYSNRTRRLVSPNARSYVGMQLRSSWTMRRANGCPRKVNNIIFNKHVNSSLPEFPLHPPPPPPTVTTPLKVITFCYISVCWRKWYNFMMSACLLFTIICILTYLRYIYASRSVLKSKFELTSRRG